MKKTLITICFLLPAFFGFAQASFVSSGKIEYERKTNTHRLYLSDENDSWIEEFKKIIPQFKTSYFDLLFSGNKSIYKPGKENDDKPNGFFESPAGKNHLDPGTSKVKGGFAQMGFAQSRKVEKTQNFRLVTQRAL